MVIVGVAWTYVIAVVVDIDGVWPLLVWHGHNRCCGGHRWDVQEANVVSN